MRANTTSVKTANGLRLLQSLDQEENHYIQSLTSIFGCFSMRCSSFQYPQQPPLDQTLSSRSNPLKVPVRRAIASRHPIAASLAMRIVQFALYLNFPWRVKFQGKVLITKAMPNYK
jgi:hypothetical protein